MFKFHGLAQLMTDITAWQVGLQPVTGVSATGSHGAATVSESLTLSASGPGADSP